MRFRSYGKKLLTVGLFSLIFILSFSSIVPRISGFNSGEFASQVIGQSSFTIGGFAATQSGMNTPKGLAFDGSGNLWVADSDNNRILEFSAPLISGESASLVIGQSDFTSHGAATTQSGLSFPTGLAFDGSGNLMASDYGNNRVLEFAAPLSSGEFSSVVLGQSSFTSGTSATTQSGITGPDGIRFDPKGDLWIADLGNNRVLEFTNPLTSTLTSTFTSTVTSTGTTTITTTVTSTSTATSTTTKTPVCIPGSTNPKVGQILKFFCSGFPPNSSVRIKVFDLSTHAQVLNTVLSQKTNSAGAITFSIKITSKMVGSDLASLYSPSGSSSPKTIAQFKTS